MIANESEFPPRSPFLRLKRAAAYFGVSERTLFDWRKRGLPTLRERGCVVIDVDRAKQWLERRQDL